jgi:tetratricopeptide (TPR) repeat protein
MPATPEQPPTKPPHAGTTLHVVSDVANSLTDREAIAALVNDLQWQLDQLGPRGVVDNGGKPYNPAYYKRGLQNAIDRGELAVADYVRHYVYKAPSDGYKKLAEADSLDLACEALVADADKPYAHLFTDADRAAASKRLAPHIEAIERRKAATTARIEERHSELPEDVEQLRDLAAEATGPEEAIAVNTAILQHAPDDVVAMNRLGRAYEAIGSLAQARETFEQAVAVDPDNSIAVGRLRDLVRSQRR